MTSFPRNEKGPHALQGQCTQTGLGQRAAPTPPKTSRSGCSLRALAWPPSVPGQGLTQSCLRPEAALSVGTAVCSLCGQCGIQGGAGVCLGSCSETGGALTPVRL